MNINYGLLRYKCFSCGRELKLDDIYTLDEMDDTEEISTYYTCPWCQDDMFISKHYTVPDNEEK